LPANTPAGTYTVSYTATVNDQASGTVGNAVEPTGGGDPDPECANCTTEHPLLLDITAQKTSNPANGEQVEAGETITYTLTATVTGSATTEDLVLTDTLDAGLTFGAVTDAGSFAAGGSSQTRTFTLPANTPAGTYTVSYTATVNDQASGTVGNAVEPTGGGDPDPECANCTTEHPLLLEISAEKTSDPGDGRQVEAGQTITYTLTATVTGSATTEPLVLTDTLDAGLTFGAVTNAGSFTAGGSGQTRTFTLPADTPAGIYSVTYTATVNDQAATTVGNSVAASGGGDPDPECTNCATEHSLLLDIVTEKTADPADGTQVEAGDTITYTLVTTITGSAAIEDIVLTDTLDDGLTYGAVATTSPQVQEGGSGQTRTFTLVQGTSAGTYTVTYTATVNDGAAGTVGNQVTASTGACENCSTEHPLLLDISAEKSSDPADGTQVEAGQTITYTLIATVTGSATTEDLILADTLDDGLTFGAVTNAGTFTAGGSGQARTFTLPAGTAAGDYAVTYTATVNDQASGTVGNSVTASGGGDPDPECTNCSTEHPLLLAISAEKTSDPASGEQVDAGQTITYTLIATVTGSATTEDLVLTDTLSGGLTFDAVTNAGLFTVDGSGQTRTFTLPSGTAAGAHTVTYTARVDDEAVGALSNAVDVAGGGDPDPECTTCSTEHEVAPPAISFVKRLVGESGPTDDVAEAGETLTYEITLTNEGGFTDSYAIQDVLDENLVFAGADNDGAHSGGSPGGGTVDWTGLSVPARIDGENGTLVLAVSATVADPLNADGPLGNIVKEPGGPDPDCPSDHCVLIDPQNPELAVEKTGVFEDSDGDGAARVGDRIAYTFTVTNTGNVPLSDVVPQDDGPLFGDIDGGGT
ncbi:isopeptide-forming domain-containing fimbrial protein, partial [Nitratireductor sp. GCM10026969]|uniref:isopeptide-forming domain-containing fimbrial protein n=1 Tax=Nitratireductor sp. GCM10026969 TaxID=3252645 RepID=UPI0036179CEE